MLEIEGIDHISDEMRAVVARAEPVAKGIVGKRLTYRRPHKHGQIEAH
jgi:hypothetical protein